MGEDIKEYVILTKLTDDREVKSLVRAPNLQEATRKALKLIPSHVPYRGIAIHEVRAGVTEDA